jgi:hypothetical protein
MAANSNNDNISVGQRQRINLENTRLLCMSLSLLVQI